MEKYCTYCKKAGHKREDCWSLNGRPGKERTTTKKEIEKGKQVDAISKDEQSHGMKATIRHLAAAETRKADPRRR